MNDMEQKKKMPQVRFKGYDDTWEQRKLENISDVKDGTHDSPKYVQNGHPFITSKNVGNGFINYDDIQYVSDKDYDEINRRSKVDIHDILMGMIGTIGNLALIREKPDFAIKNVALIKYTGDIDYKFLYQILQSHCVTSQLLNSIDGGTQKFIALNKIRGLDIPYPGEEEQRKIGLFFEQLDNLITLHQRKYDKLIKMKRAMLEKMFPKNGSLYPEIRFEGFTDAWEQRKLGEVGKARSGIGFPEAEQGGTLGMPFLKVSDMNIAGNENEMIIANNYVTEAQIESFHWSPIEEVPAIFFAKVGAAVMLNRKRLCRSPFLLDNNTMAYSLNDKVWNADFAKVLFETIDLTSLVQIGALPSYNTEDIEKIMICLPILAEQRKIGVFFRELDNLITFHQRKLEKLKNIKKACLEKMFV